jgi:hypothetical protein
MAIKLTVTTPQGFEATNAYHRVESVHLLSKEKIRFFLCAYKSENESSSFDIHTFECAYDLNGDNPIKQAYVFVKTLPDFENATDC